MLRRVAQRKAMRSVEKARALSMSCDPFHLYSRVSTSTQIDDTSSSEGGDGASVCTCCRRRITRSRNGRPYSNDS